MRHPETNWNKFVGIACAPAPLPAPKGRLAARRGHDHALRQRGRWMTQLSDAPARTRAQIKERTLRTDPWWNRGRVVATLLTIWVAYATVRVFTGHWYYVPQYHYLTPFYSPCVSGECVPGSSALGHWIPAIPPIIPYAFVSLPFVLGFRLTLLLLPGRLLPGVLAVAQRVRGARAAREVLRRDQVAADRAEPAPLLLLHGVPDRDPAHLRRGAGVPRARTATSASGSARSSC